MNKQEYDILYQGGWNKVLNHYGKALLQNRITKEQYDKALQYWKKEFNGNSTRPNETQEEITQENNETDQSDKVVEQLIKAFGGKEIYE